MESEEDKELEELLRKKREMLLRNLSKKNESSFVQEQVNSSVNVYDYLSEPAAKYLNGKFSDSDRKRVIDALLFLIREGLVEKPISLEALAYIARRVLGLEYKIYIEEENELKEL